MAGLAPARRTEPVERRFGLFLRPDPVTCRQLSEIVRLLWAQFGLRSAAAFPPHVTLLGSMSLESPPGALINAVDPVLKAAPRFTVHNAGLTVLDGSLVYDMHLLPDGSVNADLVELRSRLVEAARGVAQVPCDTDTAPWDSTSFRAHLSVANHELRVEPWRLAEVGEFVRGLGVSMPACFEADTFALVETQSVSFATRWWEDLTWQHLHSWLPASAGNRPHQP